MAHQASFSTVNPPTLSLTPDLYQKLMNLLSPSNPKANFVGNVPDSLSSAQGRTWVIDSGASHHMCHDQTLFSEISSPSHAPNDYVCLTIHTESTASSSAASASGFTQSQADHSLFSLITHTSITIVLVYIDDILVAGIFLNQRKYTLDILTDSGQLGARTAHFPMEQNLKLTDRDGSLLTDPVSSCMLLEIHTCRLPSVFFAISKAVPVKASFSHHLAICMLLHEPHFFVNKKKMTVARSSAEAEYRAMTVTTCELTWLKQLLTDLGISHSEPISLYCDNQSTLHIAHNPVFHEHTKHIEIDCHIVCDKIRASFLTAVHTSSHEQLANIFTKALGQDLFHHFLHKLGIMDLYVPT
ncbi:uncharacterized protein LOC121262166 [Juglans microcarpa x Juglans regia]|uniref:uncharacterized protein LOC121262166 n=1 Tax=Juglans microcarpa x Juglans regia TaxID=2249226 RepID=UPI001B7DBD0D|nr:uncharacterized protein LOC121262166 [Juglans microcarpa x Juglans regia]